MTMYEGHRERWQATQARHEEAVTHAEVRKLALALAPFGVLSREKLKERCGGDHWSQGSFDDALRAGLRTGVLEELPGGFYREAR